MHRRFIPAVAIALLCAACADDTADPVEPVSASGTAFSFSLPGEPYGRIEGDLHVLEDPELTARSNADGEFVLDGLTPGMEATFVITADGYPSAHTKTFTVPDDGVPRLTFQVPDDSLFILMSRLIALEVDPERCQIVTTVTRVGRSIWDEGAHGEAEALVTIEPPLPAEHGPVYFNEDVIPDLEQRNSSLDGGVVFTNVPTGTYTLTAAKDGVEFQPVTVQCRAGILVNASPPYGLQALE